MATVSIQKDTYLFKAGDPVEKLYLTLKGKLLVSFPGGEYVLSAGEVPGIYGLSGGVHNMSCRTLEDCSLLELPLSDLYALETFFKENADYSILLLRSAFRQIHNLLQVNELSQLTCANLYTDFEQDYEKYQNCCVRHGLTAVFLPDGDMPSPFIEENVLDFWSVSYYDGFLRLLSAGSSPLTKEASVLTGLIATACTDCNKILLTLQTLSLYQTQIISLYCNRSQSDLLKLYTDLANQLGSSSPETDFLYTSVTHICGILKGSSYTDFPLFAERMKALPAFLLDKPVKKDTASFVPAADLTGSLDRILEYAEMDEAFCTDFKALVSQYKRLPDKSSTEDSAREIRLKITSAFYKLYSSTFFISQRTPAPLPVQLFLYFGYVDEDLAGAENTGFLCEAAKILSANTNPHVYTFYDWLTAIYTGKKEPSRNEFDEDYTDFIHAQKVSKKITAVQETALLQDLSKKVTYELENLFPSVNKMTYGRISTFCPLFSAHNLLKQPKTALVTPVAITDILTDIIAIDHSVFCREYIYTNTAAGIPKESLHQEVLPDMILMPNIGTRGVMWQEIEGRRRSTPARMLLSIFYLEDLRSAVVRLAGEYRWEMCKRIQGARWNDLSERSLTSEYFDYVQFYKKNHDLSPDTKERIKSALQKARNSFKEMFVRDYITYILYESTGSPRLTKPARTILFTYCPFSSAVRNTLKTNPIYKEIVERYRFQLQQQLRKLDLLEKRTGSSVPEELVAERALLLR